MSMLRSNLASEPAAMTSVEVGHGSSPDQRARRWTRAFFLMVAVACAAVASLNLVVNPYGYYPTRWFPALTWSSRGNKVSLLQRAAAPSVLVLGSSRTMKVAPDQVGKLSGKRAFNACVDSARVEDWLALYRYAREAVGLSFDELVLGIDIEAFHDHVEPDGRLLATRELRPYVPRSMRWQWLGRSLTGLLGYPQLVDSVRSLRISRTGYPSPPYRFDPDGFVHDTVERRFDPTAGAGDPQFAAYEGRFAGFIELDGERRALFEELAARAKHDGVRVRAFVTPLHPLLVEHLRRSRDFDRLRELVVRYLRSVTARYPNMTVTDLTDIAAFGGDPTGFTDAAHTDDENSRRMTEALWADHAVQ